jgi:hypothetical protein
VRSEPVRRGAERITLGVGIDLGRRHREHHGRPALVNIYLDMAPEEAGAAPLPGSYQLGGAFGVYPRLHLLGLNPANWTTDPLG